MCARGSSFSPLSIYTQDVFKLCIVGSWQQLGLNTREESTRVLGAVFIFILWTATVKCGSLCGLCRQLNCLK